MIHPSNFDTVGTLLPRAAGALKDCPTLSSVWTAKRAILRAAIPENPMRMTTEDGDRCPLPNRDETVRHDDKYTEQENGGRESSRRLRLFPYLEQELNGFLESAPDPVVIADQDGWIIRVNALAEQLFGYFRSELLGKEVEMLIPKLNRALHVLQTQFANPSTRPLGTCQLLSGLRKDGHTFPADISLSLLATPDGFVIACAIRDITKQSHVLEALRLQVKELEAADRNKDEFLAMLAHELRNPLAAIRNAVYVLKNSVTLDAKLRWTPDMIDRQTDHMAHLMEDLLDLSRIAHGKLRIRKELVQVDEIVGQAVETCMPLVGIRKQQLTVSLPTPAITLLADSTRLVQVLTNLLTNAAKYTQDGGKICLIATAEANDLVVRIRDNGIGISKEMLPRVFDLFTQVPESLDRSDGGLGIGLATVRHLVLLHGGTVHGFSEGEGRGSEFVIRIPICAVHESAKATSAGLPKPRAE